MEDHKETLGYNPDWEIKTTGNAETRATSLLLARKFFGYHQEVNEILFYYKDILIDV